MAYGTWYLQQKCAEERYRQRVPETLNELLPLAAGVLVPKGYALGDDYEFFGYTAQEQAEFAYSALSRRLKVIGVGLPRRLGRLSRLGVPSLEGRCPPVLRARACSRAPDWSRDGRCAGERRGSPRARGRRRR